MKKIVDESIFQGWHEFGGYRYENRGSGIYSVYQKTHDGIGSPKSFVHCAIIRIDPELRGQSKLQALQDKVSEVTEQKRRES